MTPKTAKTEMMQAHEAIAAALDAKIGNMPEWKAFRAVDRALLALEAERPMPAGPASLKITSQIKRRRLNGGAYLSYMALADQALKQAGKPVSTPGIVDYISKHRPLLGDPDKAKIVIQSSLSKDKRFESVPWEGRRAWWYADKPIPKNESAG